VRNGHVYGLFEPRTARKQIWRPLWKAQGDLDRERELPRGSNSCLGDREISCREVARWRVMCVVCSLHAGACLLQT
jgi:hypothetical protein